MQPLYARRLCLGCHYIQLRDSIVELSGYRKYGCAACKGCHYHRLSREGGICCLQMGARLEDEPPNRVPRHLKLPAGARRLQARVPHEQKAPAREAAQRRRRRQLRLGPDREAGAVGLGGREAQQARRCLDSSICEAR